MRTGNPYNPANTRSASAISSGGYKFTGNQTAPLTATNHKTSIAFISPSSPVKPS